MQNNKTPKQGLDILEKFYQQHPTNGWIRNVLVDAYIHLGIHDKAISLINKLYNKKTDVQSLRFKAWVAHQQGDFTAEQQLWDSITDKSYYAEYHGILGSLFGLIDKEITLTPDDIPLFSVQRNEMLRLPCFLDYYRKLGVTKFFFTDNNSDDGSFEYLLAQPDCYVFWTKDSHLQAGAGMVWNQHLIQKYVLDNQWYLVIDADELLIYPNCETFPLPIFINYLNQGNYDAVSSYALDMFPKNQQEQLSIQSGDNLIEKSPYFYNHYIFKHQIESPYHKVVGGIFHVFGQNIPLNVTPLLKKRDPYIKLLSSRHLTTPTKIADVTSCLLHFKFIGDFYKKSLDETKRKQHWGGGIAYKRYMQFFDEVVKDDFNFTDLEKTTKFENSQQLVNFNLIQNPDSWKNFTLQQETTPNLRTPKQALIILENLHKKHINNQYIINHLIDAYIKFGYSDKAITMINNISKNKDDTQILKWQAWIEYQHNNTEKAKQIWDTVIKKSNNYVLQIHGKIKNFIPKTHEKLQLQNVDIPLFCVQRNEILRLPIFLDYYRDLGITKFIFIDNNSDDGSFEFLMEQPDCYVFWTDDSYLQSAHGLTWLNHLINETDILNINQWYLIADVDELLVYPDCENRKLPILIDYLNQEKSEAVSSFMLDMYADNLLGHDDNNFINEHVYFYNNYYTYYQASSPYIAKAGGIRIYLYSEYNDACVKTALFKKLNRKSYLLSSTHETTPYKVSKITTAFKHYKFVNLKTVAKNELQRKQHSGGGSRYRQYHNHFQNDDQPINFLTLDKTTKYENSQQLVDLNLIQTTDEWINFNQQKLRKMNGIKILENLYKNYPTNKTVLISLIKAYITTKQYEKALNLSIHHEIQDNTINNFINWYHITKKDFNINKSFYNLFQPNFGIYRDKEVDLILQSQVAHQWRILIDAYFNNDLEKFDIQPKKQFNHQKILWQYWGQGINDDELPEVVQMCFRSVDTYKADYVIIRLDDKNFHEYVDLPNFVYNKRNNPQFSHTYFSDLLRLVLLNTYGGIWLDARILLTNTIPDKIKSKDFFMFQRDDNIPQQEKDFCYRYNYFYFNWNKSHHINVMNGFIISKKGNKIINILMNLLLNYWKTQNCIPHYFFFQILFDVLSKEYLVQEMDKEIIDDIKPHLLQFVINDNYNESILNNILSQTTIHSLSRNHLNNNTFYTYFLNKFCNNQL